MRTALLLLGLALVLAAGAAGVVAGEADDSPGLQGLGLLLALAAVAGAVRVLRRRGSLAHRHGPE